MGFSKKIFVLILIFLVIISFSFSSFCAVNQYDYTLRITEDVIQDIYLWADTRETPILANFDIILSNNTDADAIASINTFMQMIAEGYYYYIDFNSYYAQYRMRMYASLPQSFSGTYELPYGAEVNNMPLYSGSTEGFMASGHHLFTTFVSADASDSETTKTITIPSFLYCYRTDLLKEFMNKWYYKTDNKFDDLLNDISLSLEKILEAQQATNSNLQELQSAIEDLKKSNDNNFSQNHEDLVEVSDQLKQLNDFMNNDSINDSEIDSEMNFNYDNPTNDITADGFNSIFLIFQSAFTENRDKNIQFPIPFTNKSMSINTRLVYNALGGENSFLVKLIEDMWLCLASLFIVKDVERYIEKLKNGNIISSTDTNIKSNML